MNMQFTQNIIDIYGEEGKKWLERTPQIIATYEKKWDIKVGLPFNLSYNYVAPATCKDNSEAVIKIGFPGDIEFVSECAGLRHFNGQGAARLLHHDIEKGVMLLEKVTPGIVLHESQLSDEEQTKVACKLLNVLSKPASNDANLIDLSRWRSAYKTYRKNYSLSSGPIPENIFLLAEALDTKHFSMPQNNMLIHGDFHHDNILSSNRDTWLAIDTKGVIGNPIYDIAVFLYNPMPILNKLSDEQLVSIIKNRIEIIHDELQYDESLIIEWGISKSVLSVIWTLEFYGKGWEYGVRFAEIVTNLYTA